MISPEILRRYPLFAKQPEDLLKQIAMLSQEVTVETDEWLFHQDEYADRIFIILEGGIALTMNINERTEKLSPMTTSDVIGWSAMVRPYNYTMGGQATQRTRLLAMDGQGLRALFDHHPEAGYLFLRNLAEVIGERLISKYTQLASLTLAG